MDIDLLSRNVLFNCDVSDALHAGIYSVCGLAMRLRDLYKWEQRLPPWKEDDAARVLDWIGRKEDLWETLLEAAFDDVKINGRSFDPFDTRRINAALAPHGFFYGAGYAHSLKPTFFLAEIERQEMVAGHNVVHLGREHARDLLTLPAFGQDGDVVLRGEAAQMFLWDQIAYISNSGRRALDFALTACGLPDNRPGTLRSHFDVLLNVQQQIYLQHEIGELEENVFTRDVWQRMLGDFPHTPVELLIRTLKDLLADTGPQGPLTRLIDNRDEAALGLYFAFGNGFTRQLTRELICAFDAFVQARRWNRMADAALAVRQKAVHHTARVMELYRQGGHNPDAESTRAAIEAYMQRTLQ